MKIQTIKSAVIDAYGNKYVYKTTTKVNKNKQTSNVVVTCNNKPIYKAATNGKSNKEYDMGLFGNWILRK